jgi:hypothetical protein
MQIFQPIAVALAAVSLAGVAVPALASPSNRDEFTYRTGPPSSNPHDVFRTITKAPKTPGATAQAMAMKDCRCPMMQGGGAKPSQTAPVPQG